jgi:hypothetical protein
MAPLGKPGPGAPPEEQLAFLVLHADWYPRKLDAVQAARLLCRDVPCEAALLVVHRCPEDRPGFEGLLAAAFRPEGGLHIVGAGTYSLCQVGAPPGSPALRLFFCADLGLGGAVVENFLEAGGGFVAGYRTPSGGAVGLTFCSASLAPWGERPSRRRKTLAALEAGRHFRLADLWFAKTLRARCLEGQPEEARRLALEALDSGCLQVAAYRLAGRRGPSSTVHTVAWKGVKAAAFATAAPPPRHPLSPRAPPWVHLGDWPDVLPLAPPLQAQGGLLSLSPTSAPPAPHRTLDAGQYSREVANSRAAAECVVCLDRDVETSFDPCGHQVCCAQCAGQLAVCPICRRGVQAVWAALPLRA